MKPWNIMLLSGVLSSGPLLGCGEMPTDGSATPSPEPVDIEQIEHRAWEGWADYHDLGFEAHVYLRLRIFEQKDGMFCGHLATLLYMSGTYLRYDGVDLLAQAGYPEAAEPISGTDIALRMALRGLVYYPVVSVDVPTLPLFEATYGGIDEETEAAWCAWCQEDTGNDADFDGRLP